MNCPNCKNKLSCVCQRRTASDGKQCCSKCVVQYNNSIDKSKQQKYIRK